MCFNQLFQPKCLSENTKVKHVVVPTVHLVLLFHVYFMIIAYYTERYQVLVWSVSYHTSLVFVSCAPVLSDLFHSFPAPCTSAGDKSNTSDRIH